MENKPHSNHSKLCMCFALFFKIKPTDSNYSPNNQGQNLETFIPPKPATPER